MNEKFDSDMEPERHRDREGSEHRHDERRHTNGHSRSAPQANGRAPAGSVSVWTFAEILAHRWHWPVIGAILGVGAFLALAGLVVQPKFTATAQLLRYETITDTDFLRGPFITSETFSGLLRSPDLLRTVGERVTPPIPPERFIKQSKIDPQPDSDVVKIVVAAREPQQAVDLANYYAEAAVDYTTRMQANQALQVANNYLSKYVEDMDRQIAPLYDKLRGIPGTGELTNKLAEVGSAVQQIGQHADAPNPARSRAELARLNGQLQKAIEELNTLTIKFTDAHPQVQAVRETITELEGRLAQGGGEAAAGMGLLGIGPGGTINPELGLLEGRIRALEDARVQLHRNYTAAQAYAENPPGLVRVLAPASLKTVEPNHRNFKIAIVAIFGGFIGIAGALALLLLVEFFDSRLKTADDVARVTKLPVLASLGELTDMKNGSREEWAFRAWTMLQGRLSRSHNHGLVCGITSAHEGEGRSTWIGLLAEAASLSGFRVLTIATKPTVTPVEPAVEPAGHLTEETLNNESPMNANPDDAAMNQVAAITSNVLSSPSQVTDQLTAPDSEPVVHIPLPGWVWNLERRKQWGDALQEWRKVDNLVIFVELPPASIPEAILLGSNLPNLLWLTESGTAKAEETRTHMETLRNARCNLVGAVLNREQSRPLRSRFPRWLSCLPLLIALTAGSARAQDTNASGVAPESPPPADVNEPAQPTPADVNEPAQPQPARYSLSAMDSSRRPEWTRQLTLGPGDVLTFALYGEPLAIRQEVAVGPDGRVSYLEAQDIMAAGLTIDELRARIDESLAEVRRAPRTVITPVAFKSKKYFMLGKVVQRGVYTLDRPITVIEALARAKGLEIGLVNDNTLDLADLQRSFLMRNGKRYELNFEKLFQDGDLSQNIQIEPNDYLFFPSSNTDEVYVLGEVGLPGRVYFRPDTTVLTAVSSRGGFNEKAYRQRVLVIRGSLNKPETFAVNTHDVMNGKARDFKLRPKDIIYVSHRPWWRAEDLLDMATTAFVQSLVTTWVGVDVLSPNSGSGGGGGDPVLPPPPP